jgi:hypothetical protein
MGGAIPLLLLYAFVARTGARLLFAGRTFLFPVYCFHRQFFIFIVSIVGPSVTG